MGECTVVLVGGNNGGKEHLLQELLGRRQGGAWCYSYRHITYDLRLLPLCALQSPALCVTLWALAALLLALLLHFGRG